MKKTLSNIWRYRFYLRYILKTLYFNFHYLPFRQAVRLPILVYKMKCVSMKGSVVIDAPFLKTGMIQLGAPIVSIYPNTGVVWDNHGGRIVFRGECRIGGDCAMSFGKHTEVEFGDKFVASASWKCISYRGMQFGENTRFGWNTMVMDTDLHRLYDRKRKTFKPASGKVVIGPHNWFATDCKVLHSTVTPERCIFATGTIVTRNCVKESYCVMGGSPVRVLSCDVMRIYGQDADEE